MSSHCRLHPRLASLKNANDYRDVLQGAATLRARSSHIDIFLHPRLEGYRLGLIVSKRCYRRAVDRNRAKRLFREYARLHLRGYLPMDAVVRLKRPLESLTLSTISAYLDALLLKANPSRCL